MRISPLFLSFAALALFLIPIPTEAAYCPQLSAYLQLNSRDASTKGEVTELQKFFASYYNIPSSDAVSGFFGKTTQGYVLRFQKEQGISQVGTTGPQTRAAILKACAGGASQGVSASTQAQSKASVSTSLDQFEINSFTATPNAVRVGEGATLAWTSSLTEACNLMRLESNKSFYMIAPNISPNGSYTLYPQVTTEYAISCSGKRDANGVEPTPVQKNVTVTVLPSPTPIIETFTSSLTKSISGQAIRLTWNAPDAGSCSIDATDIKVGTSNVFSNAGPSGTYMVYPSQMTTYQVTCLPQGGKGQQAKKSLTVSVENDPPTCTLTPDKTAYQLGEVPTLSWTTMNAKEAEFFKDPSSTLKLPGGKVALNGSAYILGAGKGTQVPTLVVYNHTGYGSCRATFPVR